jgi:hypothetical protein
MIHCTRAAVAALQYCSEHFKAYNKGLRMHVTVEECLNREERMDSHYLVSVPQKAICVEVSSGIKPEVDALLSIANAVGINVGLKNVGLP